MKHLYYLCVLVLLFTNCNFNQSKKDSDNQLKNEQTEWLINLDELTDEDYKYNPDISIRHSKATEPHYDKLKLTKTDDSTFTFTFIPSNNTDTIILSHIRLMEWIPTVCEKVKGDSYLTEIALINQEWNRHQVKFLEGQFEIKGDNTYDIKRVDLARNCLNAYLWELITYAEEDSVLKPFYHTWFNFPKDLYANLFENRNNLAYQNYSNELEEWEDPEQKEINLNRLRTIKSEKIVSFKNLNNEPYPLKGERKKKYPNIIYPKNTTIIDDFLTDSTTFSTFSPPGFYNPEDPRKTKLSLLKYPFQIYFRDLESGLIEIEVDYYNIDSSKITKLIVSGIDKKDIPALAVEDVNKGWMNSMGFGNHTFYETYEHCLANGSKKSEYFSVLLDENNKWIDSHDVGIDGPLVHYDINDKHSLHLWILAFERHAFVGHYAIELPK
jgi:hypothetical protein